MFMQIPQNVEISLTPKQKIQKLMTDIGGGWYIGKSARGLPPLNKTKPSKKSQERQDVIQKKLFETNRWRKDWKFQLHWNKLEWVDPKSNPKIVKPYSVSSTFLNISKIDRKSHFVGHSILKELDIDDFYKIKQMNEEMEGELMKTDSIPDNLEVPEDESVDEAVPIDIIKEIKTKAYKETMSQDINKIDTYETRKKVNTTK